MILNQACFVFISVLTPLSIAPLTPIFVEKFDKTLPEVALLVSNHWCSFEENDESGSETDHARATPRPEQL